MKKSIGNIQITYVFRSQLTIGTLGNIRKLISLVLTYYLQEEKDD